MSGPFALAIETATGDMAVSLSDEDGPLAEMAVRRGRRHAETLHPAIERVCAEAGVPLGRLDVVGVDVGPGLFTGLRVGVTAAKMLALALDVPLAGATSLDVLAAAARPLAGRDTVVVPVIDMRRGEVAWLLEGEIRLGSPAELAPAVAASLAQADGCPRPGGWDVLLVGDGARAHGEAILAGAATGASAGDVRLRLAGDALAAPPAPTLAALALERLASGVTDDAATLVPLYLREADAAINWESRPGRPPAAGETGAA